MLGIRFVGACVLLVLLPSNVLAQGELVGGTLTSITDLEVNLNDDGSLQAWGCSAANASGPEACFNLRVSSEDAAEVLDCLEGIQNNIAAGVGSGSISVLGTVKTVLPGREGEHQHVRGQLTDCET